MPPLFPLPRRHSDGATGEGWGGGLFPLSQIASWYPSGMNTPTICPKNSVESGHRGSRPVSAWIRSRVWTARACPSRRTSGTWIIKFIYATFVFKDVLANADPGSEPVVWQGDAGEP
jgi:hypothetical protein